jgi:large subunit ribosomal protein L22
MKARLKQYQQSPRKVRLVADAVRGMSIDRALKTLEFMPKKSATALHKLLSSALANTGETEGGNFYIKTLMVDEGPRARRFRPGFKGRADRFYRRSSHVTVELAKHNNLTPAPAATKGQAK